MEQKNILSEKTFGRVKVIQLKNRQWGVTDINDNVIVPFGKYDWIDGFDHGFARVKIGKCLEGVWQEIDMNTFECKGTIIGGGNKWGIINRQGEEVLPVEYDSVWNFYGKNRESTTVEKNEKKHLVWFDDLNQNEEDYDEDYSWENESGWSSYDEYGGPNGYDDFTVDEAFEGDPSAVWNID